MVKQPAKLATQVVSQAVPQGESIDIDFSRGHRSSEVGSANMQGKTIRRRRIQLDLTQAELAHRMGTTQSAIARMEGGGAKPSLETLERLAAAVGKELVVGFGEGLSENRSIAKLVRDGHAVVRAAS